MSPIPGRTGVLSAILLVSSLAFAQTRSYSEGGYAGRRSVAVGETISFHISTSLSPFEVEVVNLASPHTVLDRISGLMSQPRDCTGMWENGCGWPATTTFTVPQRYTPGYYAARFPTSLGDRHILFVVRPAVLGSYAPIAVIQPTNTDTAYNRFGGKSVYDPISDDGHRAHVVSFNRPYFDGAGLARFHIWEDRFVTWMKQEGRRFEVVTDDDLEAGLPLGAYKALLIVGHSEYWSLNARRNLEAYSRSGGHLAVFGANTMWWQVRTNLQSRQMTVYKDAALDPMTGVNDELVTTNFHDWPVFNYENTILGASFANAGYVNRLNSVDRLPLEQRTPYRVRNAGHWAFAGTGLGNGAAMGRSVGAIEVDGALFNTLPTGEVVVEGSDGTPLSYEVLATLPASFGYATIGMYVNQQGAAVFNGAARDWAYGLAADPVIQQMTRNVLDRLSTGDPFEYRPRSTPNRAEDLFNTPLATPEFLPGWRYLRQGFALTSRCAFEGPTGLELAGPNWTIVMRQLAVSRTGLSKGAANVWLNVDALQSTPNFATALLRFIDYRPGNLRNMAVLEHMVRPEGRAIRFGSFDGAVQSGRTDWVVLTPGWHSVQVKWESPGILELNVSGKKVSAVNPTSNQRVNALALEFAGNASIGTVCADALQFRDAFAPASAAASRITASRETISTDKRSSSEIVVQLVDESGHALVNGGDVVTLSTTQGTLSAVRDAGDGTYAATFTPGPSPGTATITATVNGARLEQAATVSVVAAGRRRSVRN